MYLTTLDRQVDPAQDLLALDRDPQALDLEEGGVVAHARFLPLRHRRVLAGRRGATRWLVLVSRSVGKVFPIRGQLELRTLT